jgi:hypothetical protein
MMQRAEEVQAEEPEGEADMVERVKGLEAEDD